MHIEEDLEEIEGDLGRREGAFVEGGPDELKVVNEDLELDFGGFAHPF